MSQALAYFFGYSPVVLLFVAAALVPVLAVGLAVGRPAVPVFAYIVVLFSFTQTSYGALEAESTIYSRGTGQLFFSLLAWTLIGLVVAMSFRTQWSGKKPIATNLGIPFMLLALLFAGNLMVAAVLGIEMTQVLSNNGFVNLLFMGLFVFVMVRSMGQRVYLVWFERLLLIVGTLRAGFGLARWVALGGDTSNVYENVEHLGIKITYFDICDSMIAGVVLLYCLRRLFADWRSLRVLYRIFLASLIAMELAVIVLSYRRTAWGGLGLVLLFFFFLLPYRQKIVPLVAMPLVAIPIWLLGSQRLGNAVAGQSFFGMFVYDIYSKNNFVGESPRTLELKAAFRTFLDNPIFGTGAWGHYQAVNGISWQAGPDAFSFVHSGVLHILLKTGLVGMAIVVSAIFLYVRFVIRARGVVSERDRWLFDASVAGLIFMIPDFMLGTPVPQFRTMLLYGVMIALPYLIAGIGVRERLTAAP